MEQLVSFFTGRNTIWLIPLFFLIHELEEWNILKWYRKNFINLPASTNVSIRIHIFAFGFAWAVLALVAYATPPVVGSLVLAFMSGFILMNTVQHVIQTYQFRSYAPGVATAIACSLVCIAVNVIFVFRGEVFVPWYCIVLLGAPTIMRTIRLKNRMTPEIRRVHEFFIRVEKLLHDR